MVVARFGTVSRLTLLLAMAALSSPCIGATTMPLYYAHQAVLDGNGVIAPWYSGQNGQIDFRIRVAAETMKRYPWVDTSRAVDAGPEYMYNGQWTIDAQGNISIDPSKLTDWDNGDVGQRGYVVIDGLVDYYKYTGDPMAIAHITCYADYLLDHCQTSAGHPWPSFLISVPLKGKAYGNADPAGLIQLDIAAGAGHALLRAYQLTGNTRWFAAAKHWGDVLAEKCDLTPGARPWGRYANPENIPANGGWWGGDTNKMTGGVSMILRFLDRLIDLGYTGNDNAIVNARDAARAYLKDTLLPAWTVNDTWGRHYWDFVHDLRGMVSMNDAANYMMDHKDLFPNWRNDVRNIVALFLNACSVCPDSNADTFSGAWQVPESAVCCGRSLCYGSITLAAVLARYGAEANSEWASETARRMAIMSTYDITDAGYGRDLIDGGAWIYDLWFVVTHPCYLMRCLSLVSSRPDLYGAARENHIVRTSSVVNSVVYGKGKVEYSTSDAPANTVEVLRLAFDPQSVKAGGVALNRQPIASGNGYTVDALPNGDCVVKVRHDGATQVVIEGSDPQEIVDDQNGITFTGTWTRVYNQGDYAGGCRATDRAGASVSLTFSGNQVRLIGVAQQDGGLADVYIDGVKQLVGIDCWNPFGTRRQQVLYNKSGVTNGLHELRVVVQGARNPRSSGSRVYVDAVEWSSATGDSGFGAGGGPNDTQRMVFGYTGRDDITDSEGHRWWPGCEFAVRVTGFNVDVIPASWWTNPTGGDIANTTDDDLYRYGVHAPEFWANVTVGPAGPYHVRMKFAGNRGLDTKKNLVTILINGRQVVTKMDVEATAGGKDRAVDLAFNDIAPLNGIVEIRFKGGDPGNSVLGEAFVQAIEVGPGSVVANVETPIFQPAAGSFETATPATITCGTPEAVIHCTLDGSDPTPSSPVYSSPLSVEENLTLKARAYKSGLTPSTVNTASFQVGPSKEMLLVTCYDTGKVEEFTLEGEYLGTFATRSGCVGVLQGGDGNVYVGCTNGVAKYTMDGALIKSDFITGLTVVTDLAWHNNKLWLTDWNGSAGAYDPTTGAQSGPTTTWSGNPFALKFGPDGRCYVSFYSGSAGGSVQAWNTTTGAKEQIVAPGGNLCGLVWSGSDLYISRNDIPVVYKFSGSTLAEWAYGGLSGAGITIQGDRLYRVASNTTVSELSIYSLANPAPPLYSGPGSGHQMQQICVVNLPVDPEPIGRARSYPEGATVGCGPVAVTAVFADCFYVEEATRTSGMQVRTLGDMPAVGALLRLKGTMQTDASTGERYISASLVLPWSK